MAWMSSSLLVRRHSSRSGLSISTASGGRSSLPLSPLSPPSSPLSHASSESTTSRSSSVVSIATPARPAVPLSEWQVRQRLREDETMLRSVSYSSVRESVWEDEMADMQRLIIQPDAYSEPQLMEAEEALEEDDVEVELEVKRARGGSDVQQPRQATLLILHRKRRWIQPTERSAQLDHYSPSSIARPSLPHPLVETRSRPAVRCSCQSDGQWQPEQLLFPIEGPDREDRSDHPPYRPLHLPHADVWLERMPDSMGLYTLYANIHSVESDNPRRYRTYAIDFHGLTFGVIDEAAGGRDDAWPIFVVCAHSDSPPSSIRHVRSAVYTETWERLTMRVHALPIAHAPNFSAIHLTLETLHGTPLTFTFQPTLVRGVECSGVTGQLSVGEKHWSEEGDTLYDLADDGSDIDDSDTDEQSDDIERRVEAKRLKLAEKKAELADVAGRRYLQAHPATEQQTHAAKLAPAVAARVISRSTEEAAPRAAKLAKAPAAPANAKTTAATPMPQPAAPRSSPTTSASTLLSSVAPPATVAAPSQPAAVARPPAEPFVLSQPPLVQGTMRLTAPIVPFSSLVPLRAPPRPAALAPVSLSRWGNISLGNTTSEDSDASDEATDVAGRRRTRTGRDALVTQQPVAALPASSAITPFAPTTHHSQPAAVPRKPKKELGSGHSCASHFYLDPLRIPVAPGRFDPKRCRRCGWWRHPPPGGWRRDRTPLNTQHTGVGGQPSPVQSNLLCNRS